jgi:transcriptional regulator GlxA family with amidase domain
MLLEFPGMSVAEISLACGFSNAAYFCKVFHTAEGMTPKKYRDTYLS